MKKLVVLVGIVALCAGLAVGCATLGSMIASGGSSGGSGGGAGGSGAASASRVKTARPAAERGATAKTDAELVAEAIQWGDCAFLDEYARRDNADKQLVTQAKAAIKKYTDLDAGTGKYRTNKMDARVRQVPKDLMSTVFVDPEAALPDVTAALVKGLTDQFAKAKVLHDWICDNIAYDAEMYFSGRITSQEYDAVLKKRLAVCSGYTNLMNEMCRLAGIESIGINGFSKGFGYTGKIGRDTDHAWNAVRINGKWYLIDVTWDAGPLERRTFIKRYSTGWLFLDSRPFLYSHLPEDAAYQYYAPVLTADDFMREAYITGEFFQYGLSLKSGDPEYHNVIDGGFTFDLGVKNSGVSLSSQLRTPQGNDIDAASWLERAGATATLDYDVPDTAEYVGHVFARYANQEKPQSKIAAARFEGDTLPKVKALFVRDNPKESKITEKELDFFTDSYFKVEDNGAYYYAEDQFDTARNAAVLKIHNLIDLSTTTLEPVLNFNVKAAPGYAGFGTGVLKYPRAFTAYNDASNTRLISPIKGVLKSGDTEPFALSTKDFSKAAIIINGEFTQLAKNGKTGVFELDFEIPAGINALQLYGSRDGKQYTGLVQYNVTP